MVIWNSEFILALLGRSGSFSARVALWQVLWMWFREHLLFGVGYGAFWQQLPENITLAYGHVLKHTHNGCLEAALGLGLSGLTTFLLTLIIAWKRAFMLVRQKSRIAFFWPILALLYITLANFAYSIAFEMPDFHWFLFVVVTGLVTPPSHQRGLIIPTLTRQR